MYDLSLEISIWEQILKHTKQQLKHWDINPFAPEPPVTTRADPGPFYPLWRHQF